MDADLQKCHLEYSTWFKEFEQSTIVTPGAKGATGGNTRSNTSPTTVLLTPIAPDIRGKGYSRIDTNKYKYSACMVLRGH